MLETAEERKDELDEDHHGYAAAYEVPPELPMEMRQVQKNSKRQMSQEDGRKVVQEASVPRVHHRDEERIA